MKLTKKQWIIGGAVALVLVLAGGATAGAIHHHNVQVEQAAQEAKRAYDSLMKEAKEATEKAETFKAEADVKTAQDAIKKLNEKDKGSLIVRVERVRQNWDVVNQVNKAVGNAEKVQNDANVKTAQTAINKLTDEMVKSKKATFQKRLDKVKTAVKNNKERAKAKAKAEADKKAKTASKTVDNSNKATKSEQSSTTTANQVSTASASATNNVTSNSGGQATPQTGGGSSQPVTPSPSPAPAPTPDPSPAPTPDPTPKPDPAPTPAETYTGWVRNAEGQIVWSQGSFKTLDEAAIAAIHWMNANATGGGWSSGAY